MSMSREELLDRMGCLVERKDRIHTDKMLPCPFCGREMELVKVVMLDNKTVRYDPVPKQGRHKTGCQLEYSGGAFIGQPTTIKGAIKKWNRRANNDLQIETAKQDLKRINDPLEPIKISSALQSELIKLEFRKKNNPKSISPLDYTIIAALLECAGDNNTKGQKKQ